MANNTNPDMWHGVAREPEVPVGPPRWLLSFVDLTGILVAFFVLMFSMKAPDMGRYEELQKAMHKAFVPKPAVLEQREIPQGRLNAPKHQYLKSDGVVYLQQLLERRLGDDPFWRNQHATVDADAFELPLPPALLAGNTITPAGRDALLRLATVVRNWDNPLYVAVHAGGEARWQQLPAALALADALRAAGVTRTVGIMFLPEGAPTLLTLRVQAAE